MKDPWELGERLRLSRERLLASSDLAKIGRAWRLWAACVDATFGYAREADTTYAVTLGRSAGIDRKAASQLLHRFSELGVFVWEAAPLGSHAMSELRLPPLDRRSSGRANGDKAHQSGGLGTSLQSNTPEVQRHSYVERLGSHPGDNRPELIEASSFKAPQSAAKAGTPQDGAPAAGNSSHSDELLWDYCQQLGEPMPEGVSCSSACFSGQCRLVGMKQVARRLP
jgi:hypothetical protein